MVKREVLTKIEIGLHLLRYTKKLWVIKATSVYYENRENIFGHEIRSRLKKYVRDVRLVGSII
jgi:hypothetical protein